MNTQANIISIVKNICKDSINAYPHWNRPRLVVFSDSYQLASGKWRRRLKISGLYVTGTQLQAISEALEGKKLSGYSRNYIFKRVYRRENSMLYNYRWRNDSSVLCISFDEV